MHPHYSLHIYIYDAMLGIKGVRCRRKRWCPQAIRWYGLLELLRAVGRLLELLRAVGNDTFRLNKGIWVALTDTQTDSEFQIR